MKWIAMIALLAGLEHLQLFHWMPPALLLLAALVLWDVGLPTTEKRRARMWRAKPWESVFLVGAMLALLGVIVWVAWLGIRV